MKRWRLRLLAPTLGALTLAAAFLLWSRGHGAAASREAAVPPSMRWVAGARQALVCLLVVAWGALHLAWRRSDPPLRTVLIVTGVLLVLGLIGTFPTFFQAFASE